MKNALKFFALAAVVVFIASCTKNPAKLLQKKDGKWIAISVTNVPGFGTFTDTATITFGDGTATSVDNAGNTSTFTWTYDKKEKQMTQTEVDGSNTTVTISAVSDVKGDSEIWTFVSGTVNGTAFTTADFTSTTTLTRQ